MNDRIEKLDRDVSSLRWLIIIAFISCILNSLGMLMSNADKNARIDRLEAMVNETP